MVFGVLNASLHLQKDQKNYIFHSQGKYYECELYNGVINFLKLIFFLLSLIIVKSKHYQYLGVMSAKTIGCVEYYLLKFKFPFPWCSGYDILLWIQGPSVQIPLLHYMVQVRFEIAVPYVVVIYYIKQTILACKSQTITDFVPKFHTTQLLGSSYLQFHQIENEFASVKHKIGLYSRVMYAYIIRKIGE